MIKNVSLVLVITIIAEMFGFLRLGVSISAGIIIADGIKQQITYLRKHTADTTNPLWRFGATLLGALPALLLGCVIGSHLSTMF